MIRTGSQPLLSLPENRFALTAVEAWAAGKKGTPPVFLYGSSGVGKSHLARHGLALLAQKNPRLRVVHQDADEFAAEFAEASSRKAIPKFQAGLRDLECFILEDVHTLQGRPETQQQLLAALDDLSAHGCRILWTSRKSPGELQNMNPKLVDRFHQGVTALVRPPGLDSRRALAELFLRQHGLSVPEGTGMLIARKMPVSPRELLGLAVQLEARARPGGAVDPGTIRQLLSSSVSPRMPTLEEIARAVARYFKVTLAELRSAERARQLMMPRQSAMFLARELTDEGLAAIGEFFHRNHSTVVHACDRIRAQVPEDPVLRSHLAAIRGTLGTVHREEESES